MFFLLIDNIADNHTNILKTNNFNKPYYCVIYLVYPHFDAKRASQEQLKSPLKCFDCYAFVYCGSTLFHVKEGIT